MPALPFLPAYSLTSCLRRSFIPSDPYTLPALSFDAELSLSSWAVPGFSLLHPPRAAPFSPNHHKEPQTPYYTRGRTRPQAVLHDRAYYITGRITPQAVLHHRPYYTTGRITPLTPITPRWHITPPKRITPEGVLHERDINLPERPLNQSSAALHPVRPLYLASPLLVHGEGLTEERLLVIRL